MTVETAKQAEWKRQQRSQQISDYKAKKITDLLITKKLMHIFCFFNPTTILFATNLLTH